LPTYIINSRNQQILVLP